jgi:hypothetical protein
MTPGMPENDQQVSLKHLEQWCYYTQLDTVHINTGFPHNFDLEIPGHFQDFSWTFSRIFCMQLNSKTLLPRYLLLCYSQYNNSLQYRTS